MNPTQNLVTSEVTPSRVLRDAASYMATYGWHQGGAFADISQQCPPACALGAMRMAILGDTQPFPNDAIEDGRADLLHNAADVLVLYLVNTGAVTPDDALLAGSPSDAVADWNDDRDRNVAQVLGALSGAAQDWDNHHTGGGR